MTLRPLAASDHSALLALLRAHADTSLFMLGNLEQAGLDYQGKRYQGEFFGAFTDDDQLVAIVVQYWNGIVHSQGDATAVSDIWQEISPRLRPVKGFVGRDDLCLRLKTAYDTQKADNRYALASTEKLYALELAAMRTPNLLLQDNVQCRLVNADDHALLVDWMINYNLEALNAEDTPQLRDDVYQGMFDKIDAGATYLLLVNDRPVATSGFNAKSKPSVQVGGVWTPVADRSNGYARAVVGASLQHAQILGYQHSILFTDPENLAAQKAYEGLGYQHVGEFGLYLLA